MSDAGPEHPRTAVAIAAAVREGAVTAESVAEAALARIASGDGEIDAFLHLDDESVLRRARDVDARRAAGETLGPLAGVPVAIKDLICERGQPCTCASRMLADFRPPYSAHVIDRLLAAAAVPCGRVNMDEFAMGSSTENSAFKTTKNPWDTSRAPGGSSGGSAAAVAAGFTPVAVGTDTGGSIRQPAAFCGITGLKPTYGRVSRYGLVAFASSLDQIGPMTTDVTDAAVFLGAIAGPDARDATCLDAPVPDYAATIDEPLAGLKVGVCRDHFAEGLDVEVSKAVLEAIEVYKSLGAEVVDVDLPHSKYSVATYYIIAPSEASSNLARYDGVHYGHRSEKFDPKTEDLIDFYERNRGEAFGDEVKRRILLGTFTLSAGYSDQYYNQALKVRRLIKRDFETAFATCDVIASPATPTAAFKIGELVDDPLAMYLNDMYTIAANMAGIPAISVPCGFTAGGLPIGLQLSAGLLEEEKLLRAARMYEAATEWHTRRP